jgi:hypothetical protein
MFASDVCLNSMDDMGQLVSIRRQFTPIPSTFLKNLLVALSERHSIRPSRQSALFYVRCQNNAKRLSAWLVITFFE